MNSPYSPFAQLAANSNCNLTPFAQIDEMKQQRQRSNSSKIKKRKSILKFNQKKKSKSSNKLLTKNQVKRRASTMLPTQKSKKKGNFVKNLVTNNDEFDKYSFGDVL